VIGFRDSVMVVMVQEVVVFVRYRADFVSPLIHAHLLAHDNHGGPYLLRPWRGLDTAVPSVTRRETCRAGEGRYVMPPYYHHLSLSMPCHGSASTPSRDRNALEALPSCAGERVAILGPPHVRSLTRDARRYTVAPTGTPPQDPVAVD
jgi:hypothetical protein